MTFVKSAGTSTPVSRSQAEIEKILRRYGASGFGVTSDYERGVARVHFRVPDSQAPESPYIPIRLEVDFKRVAAILYGDKIGKVREMTRWQNGRRIYTKQDAETRMAQAERVAWRHLVDWIDAACSAAAAGLQSMSEAFLAHMLVKGDRGEVIRVIDQLNEAGGGDFRRLLPSKT